MTGGTRAVLAAAEIDEVAARVFLAIAVVVVLARVMGGLAKRVGQPAVVGEIVAGILLGPTLLGAFSDGKYTELLFPLEIRPFLQVIAQLGLIIFMFIVGLELDVNLIRGKERVAGVVSIASVALPFGLGILLAAGLYGTHKFVNDVEVPFWPFALFIGASMSVTAFPVLARILTERGMHRTVVGALTLACAAVDDILAWSMLALVVAILQEQNLGGAAEGHSHSLVQILVLSVAFIGVMFLVVKPQLVRLTAHFRRTGHLTAGVLTVVLVGILVCSYATWWIGIHAIFGAFVFGVVMPRKDSAGLFHAILERLESVSVLLLLPVFFVVTGLSVNIRGLGLRGLGELVLIMLAACLGKFLGATGAARAQGLAPRKAASIGVLMNTRGLTELVILNIGLAAGVLTGELFTLLVVMAILTTFMTTPLLKLVYPDAVLARDIEEAEKAALGEHAAHRVLVPLVGDVEDEATQAALRIAIDIAAGGRSEIVLSRLVDDQRQLEVGSGLGIELSVMARTLDELHDISADAERRGAKAVVRSQFTADAVADFTAQVSAIDPDLVLLLEPTRLVDGATPEQQLVGDLVALGITDVAVVRPGTDRRDGPVVAVLAGGDGDAAAVEVAARLARGRGAPVGVDAAGGRRTGRATDQVRRALEQVGLVTVDDPTATVLVRAHRDEAAFESSPVGVVDVFPRPDISAPTVVERLAGLAAPPTDDPSDPVPSTDRPLGAS